MSQVVSCSRCGLASELRCDLCPDMLPLCRPCANPHYRLYHEMDFNTRTPMPSIGNPLTTPLKIAGQSIAKRGRKRSPQRAISDYIKKMKQP